jgi:uncharacterized protein with PIN domain
MVKFIVTNELGRLATWLRILGYDTVFSQKRKAQLVVQSLKENRIILTRDSKMSRYSGVRIVPIESDFVEEQLKQVIATLDLAIDEKKLFTLCVRCDVPLEKVNKKNVKNNVPPYVYKTQQHFMRCPQCRKIYWQGTHWALAKKFLDTAKG